MEYVYIIHAEGTDWFKVGRSKDPERRNKQLSAQTPYATNIILAIPTSEPQEIEKYIHWQYEEYKIRGEWFYLRNHDRDGLIGCYTEIVQECRPNGVTLTNVKDFFSIPMWTDQ